MSKLLNFLLGRFGKGAGPPISTEKSVKRYDASYIHYCTELEQTLSALESYLHACDDPKEIAMQTLKSACTFYGGDWSGLLEIDLDLDIWTPVWWYNPNVQDRTKQLVFEFESFDFMPRWISSMRQGKNIVILDVNDIKDENPDEFALYDRLRVHSLIAVPFAPNPMGFLLIRNPTRYVEHSSMLSALGYVLHRAMAQQKTIESAKLAPVPESIDGNKDVAINFFGDMEICTRKGVLSERFFNSPKSSRVITYIILHPKSAHPPLEIYHTLWPNECVDPEVASRNIRGYIYRFRQAFALICDYPLIESTPNGYRLNPNLNIITDVQQFDRLLAAASSSPILAQKISYLKTAVKLYRGPLFRGAQDDHWIISQVNLYRLRYVSLINDLLCALAETKDYSCVQKYALSAIDFTPGNIKAYYWLIVSTYHLGSIALAKNELLRAKGILTQEEFSILEEQLRKTTDFSLEKLI
jgi:DNA-binding SARP family transcriptional activator